MTNLFKKAAIFTDIHWGEKNNSIQHNNDCMNFIEWFISEAKKEKCDTCFFLGDWHHKRDSLNIETMNFSVRGFERLNESFDKTYVIVGNHDLSRKSKRDLHSVILAKHLPNVQLVNQFFGEGDVTIVPWLVDDDYKRIPKINTTYTFGHFELPHFMMNAKVMMPDHGDLKREDFRNTGTMFSGHFHKRQSYNNIHYIGNAFPHNFSDEGDDERGMMILEWGEEPVYKSWPDQPTFRAYNLSDIIESPKEFFRPNMHAKVMLDIDLKYEDCIDLKEQLVTTFNLRELSLVQIKKNGLENNEKIEIGKFETVNDIVTKQITNIVTDHYDPQVLMNIYRSL